MRKKIHESDTVTMQLLREIHEWEAQQDLGNRPMWWLYREGTEEPRWWYATPWHERRRARRIRDKLRMKAKARRTFEQVSVSFPVGERQAFLRGCERLADNLAHCRKRCCNKRRFWEGPNMQERRARAKAEE